MIGQLGSSSPARALNLGLLTRLKLARPYRTIEETQ
jgi:hypothetical protein